MIDTNDTLTIDAFKKPISRKQTAVQRKSAKQRKREQRERDRLAVNNAITAKQWADISTNGLAEALLAAVREKSPEFARKIANELVKRARPDAK